MQAHHGWFLPRSVPAAPEDMCISSSLPSMFSWRIMSISPDRLWYSTIKQETETITSLLRVAVSLLYLCCKGQWLFAQHGRIPHQGSLVPRPIRHFISGARYKMADGSGYETSTKARQTDVPTYLSQFFKLKPSIVTLAEPEAWLHLLRSKHTVDSNILQNVSIMRRACQSRLNQLCAA